VAPDASFQGYRIGMPFFIPVDAHDYRFQVLDNVSMVSGNHLFKFGGEWNRTGVDQTFRDSAMGGSALPRSRIPELRCQPGYVECSDGSSNTSGACPEELRSPDQWRFTCSRQG
jgi:hypothetical protein